MKSETKKSLFFLFLTATYFSQAINDAYKFSFVYFFGFMIAVAVLYVIRNKYIGTFIGSALLLAMEFYSADYKQLTVIAFLLICAHKILMSDSSSNKSNNASGFSFICVQLSIFVTIALFIYDFILMSEGLPNLSSMRLNRTVMIFIWLIGTFIYSLHKNKKDKKKKSSDKLNKQLSAALRFMYFVSILGFAATVLFFCAKFEKLDISYTAVFFPWFVYICSMVYNGDPYIIALANSIEKALIKNSDKSKVKR